MNTINSPTSDFLITREVRYRYTGRKEYRRFEEFCNACRRDRYIGICYGPPGVGKTLSARYYARWDFFEGRDPFDDGSLIPRELAECRTLFYTPGVTNSPRQISNHLDDGRLLLKSLVCKAECDPDERYPNYRDCCELILVDEADRLKMQSLEQLRDLYDRDGFGLILIGMLGLEKRLARYPQLYSRVGFAHAYRPLSQQEMHFVLEHHWQKLGATLKPDDFTDQEAVAAIIRITAGNFRLLQRLFSQIERILKLNELSTITREVVDTARECLVIGGKAKTSFSEEDRCVRFRL
jgi:DNA transposition AAA+ family ATPase